MSKVLKVAAVAVGFVALAFTGVGLAVGLGAAATSFGIGVSASTLFLASAGLSLASGLLANTPKAPDTSKANADRLQANIDPRTPRKIIFGQTAMATDIRDQELSDDQTYFHRFLVVASHKAAAIDEIWFDDKQAWTSAGGVTSAYSGYLDVTTVLEGAAGNAINISARMGSSRRYTGLAYIYLRYKLTGNSKKSESPFAQTVPTRVTIRGKGALTYDPRLDSSVGGGSGSHRAGTQSTWAWSDSASRNPALQLLWYLLGWKVNGLLMVGKGIPPARIDLPSFITAANLCDESVTLVAGGTEPRYRTDGIFSEGDDPKLVCDNLCASMNAVLDDVDGKLRLTVLRNDLSSPVVDFTDDDIISEVEWDQTAPLDASYNIVRGTYTDPSDNSLYQAVDYPLVGIASPDGIDRIETVDLPLVQSSGQAQRLGKQRIQRMLYSGTFRATYTHRAWKVQKGSVVRQTFTAFGWTNKLFRVIDVATQVDGKVPLELREENSAIYAWDREEAAAITAAAPTIYDPFLDPIYQDLGAGSTYTLVNIANTETSVDRVKKTGGGDAWNGKARTAESFASSAYVSGYMTIGCFIGLTTDPDADTSYTSIDYGLHRSSDGTTSYWRNGAGTSIGPWTGTERYTVASDNKTVRYYVDNDVVASHPVNAPGEVLFGAFALATPDVSEVSNISFGPGGSVGRDAIVFTQEDTPSAPVIGDTWYTPSSKVWRQWDGSAWQQLLGDLAPEDSVSTVLIEPQAVTRLSTMSGTSGQTITTSATDLQVTASTGEIIGYDEFGNPIYYLSTTPIKASFTSIEADSLIHITLYINSARVGSDDDIMNLYCVRRTGGDSGTDATIGTVWSHRARAGASVTAYGFTDTPQADGSYEYFFRAQRTSGNGPYVSNLLVAGIVGQR